MSLCKNYIIFSLVLQGSDFECFSTEMWSIYRVYPKSTVAGVELMEYFYGVSLVYKCL